MIPAGVFVNISSENLQGLRALFRLAQSDAQQHGIFWEGSPAALAAAVIEFREGVGRRPGNLFHSPEDLIASARGKPRCVRGGEELHHGR